MCFSCCNARQAFSNTAPAKTSPTFKFTYAQQQHFFVVRIVLSPDYSFKHTIVPVYAMSKEVLCELARSRIELLVELEGFKRELRKKQLLMDNLHRARGLFPDELLLPRARCFGYIAKIEDKLKVLDKKRDELILARQMISAFLRSDDNDQDDDSDDDDGTDDGNNSENGHEESEMNEPDQLEDGDSDDHGDAKKNDSSKDSNSDGQGEEKKSGSSDDSVQDFICLMAVVISVD